MNMANPCQRPAVSRLSLSSKIFHVRRGSERGTFFGRLAFFERGKHLVKGCIDRINVPKYSTVRFQVLKENLSVTVPSIQQLSTASSLFVILDCSKHKNA
ncbi:hypothetical protein SUGI_0824550 [Cryptomeria japonica]|nr:hypothetical protein SUGI_0824550 [Cryptomeria japonica]